MQDLNSYNVKVCEGKASRVDLLEILAYWLDAMPEEKTPLHQLFHEMILTA